MAGKQVHDYPPDDDFVALVRQHGNVQAVARHIGIPGPTLGHYVQRQPGLRARCDQAAREHRAELLNPTTDGSAVPVDDPAQVRITQLEAAVSALKRDNGQYKKALASQEQFFDRIVEATRIPVDVPKLKPYKATGKKPPRSVIAPIYDQQYGQFVQPSDTPGNRGEFNTAVFDQRLERWVEGVCSIIARQAEAYSLKELIIPIGGDNVEGDEIFPGQAWQLEIDPCNQVWQLALKMAPALAHVIRFAREDVGVDYVALFGVGGNHGKVGGKKSGARPSTYNWDILFQNILFDRLRGEPVDEFAVETGGALFFYCAGHPFQMIHGDEVKGWGGLPFYGLTKFDGRSMRLHNTMYRYLLMGHHHQPAEIPNGAGETIVSGDWVGANNLSRYIQAGSRPQQRVLYVSEKLGVCGGEKIYFQDADEAYAPVSYYGQTAA